VPVMNARMEDRTCIEWNKDDIDALGFMKIDVLALVCLPAFANVLILLNSITDLI
jgi:error-prone DNA polymerase